MEQVVTSSVEVGASGAEQPQGDQPGDRSLRLVRCAVLGLVATTSIVVGALLGGRAFENHLPGAWYFGMQGGLFGSLGSDASQPPIYAVAAVYGGLILLTRVWFGFLLQLSRPHRVPVKKVVFVVAIWAIPLLLAPPLFSKDVYSYAGQGEMVSHHIDPYTYGTGILGSTPFSSLSDAVWTNTPSPYGPTFLTIDGALDDVTGHQILPDIVLLRLLELAGLALMVGALPTLARAVGRDPAQAVLFGAGCPLVLTTLLSGAHNDALMVGLLVAGLAVALRVGTVPGILLCAVAAGVKAPAGLGVLFLGWAWAGPGASIRRRVAHTAAAGVIAVSTLEIVAKVSGLGWGWLHTTTAANHSFTGITPIGGLSRAASDLAGLVNVHFSALGARTVLGDISLACATGIGIWLLLRSDELGVTRSLGLTLLVVALLNPILWAWYATWGVVVLAPVATGRLRTVVLFVSTFEVFAGVSSIRGIFDTLLGAGVLPVLILVAVVLFMAIVPLGPFERSRRTRITAPPVPGRLMAGLGT
jgi:hypothetical protein